MKRTVQVWPYRRLRNPETGQTASIFGACPPGFRAESTGLYTVRVVDHSGQLTSGCGRPPGSLLDTQDLARKIADRFGYTLLPDRTE